MATGERDNGVDPIRAKRMRERIIKLEKRNIQTNKSMSDKDVVDRIKAIIREEADANVD
ncbi:MAG: hypothetical protein IKE20_01970 [Eggerthellaceae bacterium]|nr:hypothetical protein [Eggerthellaceae bacterium]